MTNILAIIDLDTNRERGHAENLMVVNNSERSRVAREYADQFASRQQTSAFFSKLFDPNLVKLDVIEDQAKDLLEKIEAKAQIVYLTSRPHMTEEATVQWLADNEIYHMCFFKNYGTGEPDEDGKPDTGDRFMKTSAWKAREVQRIISEFEAAQSERIASVLFVDDEEANRVAVAEIGDPRILLRCSLEDAITHDFMRYEIAQETTPFLRRLKELANILEMRREFEKSDKCQLIINRPAIPGQDEKEQHTSVMVESWRAAAYAPCDDLNLRYYRYNELFPQRNELSEIEQIIALQACCDNDGKVISVKMAKSGPALSLLNELEEVFEPSEEDRRQKYADNWIFHSIEEFGYLEVARVQRGLQLIGKTAMDTYIEHLQAKNEELRAAFRSAPEQSQEGQKDE